MRENGLPTNWKEIPIGKICDLINGRAFKPSEWKKAGLPIVRIQNLNDDAKPFNYFDGKVSDNHLIENGDVLLSWSGTPGTSFGCFNWNGGKAVLNQHIFKVIVNEELCDKEYFIFSVNNILDEMIAQAHGGVGLRHITKGKLENLTVAVAPLEEQRRIVGRIKECLSRVDEIKKLREESLKDSGALLESIRYGIFGSVDEMPEKWTEARLDSLAEVIYGVSAAISQNRDASIGTPIIRMANMSIHGDLDLSDLRYLPLTKGQIEKFSLERGDLLLNWRSGSPAHIGKTALFDSDGVYACASFILRIRTYPEKSNNRYLRHVLNYMRQRGFFERKQRMHINAKLNATEFSKFPIRIPQTLDEQIKIADYLDEAERVCNGIRNQYSETLSDSQLLQEAILRKAFAGEL